MVHGSASPKELVFDLPWGKIAAQEWKGTECKHQILMLHGWQDNSNSFKRLVPLLPEDWWVVALDFPGHGHSSHRVTGLPYHAPDYLIDIKATVASKFQYSQGRLVTGVKVGRVRQFCIFS